MRRNWDQGWHVREIIAVLPAWWDPAWSATCMLEARSQPAIGWRAAAADSADAGRLQQMMAVLDEASRPLVRVHAEGYQQHERLHEMDGVGVVGV